MSKDFVVCADGVYVKDGKFCYLNVTSSLLKAAGTLSAGMLKKKELTHSEDKLAEMTLEIIERKLTGIFHLSGATRINR